MLPFGLISLLIVITATFSYVNYRWVRLPNTIGMMFLALLASLGLIAVGEIAPKFHGAAVAMMGHIDLNKLLVHGLLSLLLFAGCLQLHVDQLLQQWGRITLLAVVGTVLSAAIVAAGTWGVVRLLGLQVNGWDCLLFGALISPTDPVAVLGIMKRAGASPRFEALIGGESLFNDGVGVVMFVVLLKLSQGGMVSPMHVMLLLGRQVIGGITLGLWAGVLIYQLIKRVDYYQLGVLLTLALAMGGYALGEAIGVSAPLAVVVAGLFLGNRRRAFIMSDKTRQHLDDFWELVDEILNALLFLLMGLELLVMHFRGDYLAAAALLTPIVLLARWGSVASIVGGVNLLHRRVRFERGAVVLLTWGGLRGGIALALALSLPDGPAHDLIVAVTFVVVVFAIVVQGLTVGRVIRVIYKAS